MQRCVAFPIVGLHIHDHALHRFRGIVSNLPGGVATVVLWNRRTASIRIEENFGGIETHSTRRIESSVNTITIDLPRFHAGHENVPVVICPVDCGIDRDGALWLGIVNTIEKKKFDSFSVL